MKDDLIKRRRKGEVLKVKDLDELFENEEQLQQK